MLDLVLENIEEVLNRLTVNKLNAYAFTQVRLHETDISNDPEYRRTYNGFYRVRLPITDAYDTYYMLIEQNKNQGNVSLDYVLNELLEATGRIETSFGSKLLATINPNVAPLDSIVLAHLNLALPQNNNQPNEIRIQQCVTVHNQLVATMNHLITLPVFQKLKNSFTARYPGYDFTDVKILDLLLWQYRP